MTKQEQHKIERILEGVAREKGKTVAQVRADIQEVIDEAWISLNPAVRDRQRQWFPEGKPSIDLLIQRVSGEILRGH